MVECHACETLHVLPRRKGREDNATAENIVGLDVFGGRGELRSGRCIKREPGRRTEGRRDGQRTGRGEGQDDGSLCVWGTSSVSGAEGRKMCGNQGNVYISTCLIFSCNVIQKKCRANVKAEDGVEERGGGDEVWRRKAEEGRGEDMVWGRDRGLREGRGNVFKKWCT